MRPNATQAAPATDETKSPSALSLRKRAYVETAERPGHSRAAWVAKNKFFHDQDHEYLQFLIPRGLRVLELGCGAGHTLAALAPSLGVGVDFSGARVGEAQALYPEMKFV